MILVLLNLRGNCCCNEDKLLPYCKHSRFLFLWIWKRIVYIFKFGVITVTCNSWKCTFPLLLIFFFLVLDTWKEYKEYREANPGPRTIKSFHKWIRFGGKDWLRFVWKEKMDVSQRKAKNYISKIQENKDDKNDNENNLTNWDRLRRTKDKSPVRHNLDGFKQYNFTNCNVTLRK